MEKMGLSLSLMALIVLTSCGGKPFNLGGSPVNGGTTTAGASPTPAQGIKGSWTSGCLSGQVFKLVITDTTFRLSSEKFIGGSCTAGSEDALVIADYTYTYDENAEKADVVTTHGYATVWDATRISSLNSGDPLTGCGSTTWQAGVQQEITDITDCSLGNATTGSATEYPLSLSDPDTLVLAGSVTLTRE